MRASWFARVIESGGPSFPFHPGPSNEKEKILNQPGNEHEIKRKTRIFAKVSLELIVIIGNGFIRLLRASLNFVLLNRLRKSHSKCLVEISSECSSILPKFRGLFLQILPRMFPLGWFHPVLGLALCHKPVAQLL